VLHFLVLRFSGPVFSVLHFSDLNFPARTFGPSNSSRALSDPAVWAFTDWSCVLAVLHFPDYTLSDPEFLASPSFSCQEILSLRHANTETPAGIKALEQRNNWYSGLMYLVQSRRDWAFGHRSCSNSPISSGPSFIDIYLFKMKFVHKVHKKRYKRMKIKTILIKTKTANVCR